MPGKRTGGASISRLWRSGKRRITTPNSVASATKTRSPSLERVWSAADTKTPRQAGGDETEWQDFLAFLATAPAVPGPQEMFNLYGQALVHQGLSRLDTQRRVAALFDLMRELAARLGRIKAGVLRYTINTSTSTPTGTCLNKTGTPPAICAN